MRFRFDNAFLRELPGDPEHGARLRQVEGALYSRVQPTPVSSPHVVAWSAEMAGTLGLSPEDIATPQFAAVFGGNALAEGMQPWASNYGGHQFGVWAGQLGDGRAISLGEVLDGQGHRWELQLKGAGPTPYSRGADGRAVLRSSIREFLCSEAMHHLGVPTTRALCLVATGEAVVRDMFYDGHPRDEPGAIVCRVAPSFIRFGHFELPYARNDVALLRRLADFTLRRDFPHLHGEGERLYADWFDEVCERTAHLLAQWMRVGFVHGVMNTDNMSILGLTIDYGPYGWIDDYDPDWTPNTTDALRRRYRFGQQPSVAWWNLARLASAISPLFADTAPLQAGLERYAAAWEAADRANVAAKLGLAQCRDGDVALRDGLHAWMHAASADMTLTWRALLAVDPAAPSPVPFADVCYDEARREGAEPLLRDWLERYARRLREDPLPPESRHAHLRAANPKYVLRNYLAQEAIDLAEQGDYTRVHELLDIMRHPYDEQPGRERYARKRPDWAKQRPGCSMLSCSS
ncbi:protein adenylyltransferase SelO [Fulvimonas yonginensis]|uniref:Protein nucleotidyltransferase YdiU n=1 Tax=Fulvimonas yonginensis TaxID=1495200 RepID=A0ABU8J9S9_9GAMM